MDTHDEFSRTFVLKQHTPMLHFQHGKQDALLRTTEVVPKLEKLIKNNLAKIDPELCKKYSTVISQYFSGKSSGRYYKLHVTGRVKSVRTVKTYFGRNESLPSHKRLIGSYFGDNHEAVDFENLAIQIFSLNTDLGDFIFEALKWLFLKENFGCRGTKGFGCFAWNGFNKSEIKERMTSLKPCLLGVYMKDEAIDESSALESIHSDYQLIKSGRNRPYAKSELFQVMCQGKIGWEKRWIKMKVEEGNSIRNTDFIYLKQNKPPIRCGDFRYDWRDNSKIEYKYIRALLGLSDQFEYLLDSNQRDKMIVSIVSQDKGVERFKSPLIFKYYFGNVYILLESIDEKMYDLPFDFSISTKINDEKSSIGKIGTLKTPTKEEFVLEKIMQKILIKQPLNYTPL